MPINIETKAPPKRNAGSKEPPKNHEFNETDVRRAEGAQGIFQLIGLGCIITGNYSDAGAIDMHSQGISMEVARLAAVDEKVAGITDKFLQVGPYAALISVTIPLVMQIAVNHRVFKPETLAGMNVVKPEILEAQVKTQMARMAAEALRRQHEAEEELAKMQQEYASYQNGNAAED